MSEVRAGKGISLAFFLVLLRSLAAAADTDRASAEIQAQDAFPAIISMDSRDVGFRQYIADVENNRRRLFINERNPLHAGITLTIFQYSPRPDEDIFSLAARCNIPYSALASLNRLNNPVMFETGKQYLLPSCPGLFIPIEPDSDLEKILGTSRFPFQDASAREYVEIFITTADKKQETFYFFPGADFSPTERAFFLNSGFRFPLQSYRLTSTFGIRENPITGDITHHRGIDLAAPEGTAVFATAAGIVSEIGEDPVYGIYVIIRHSDRWSSLYGHLQKSETTLRTEVKSGNLIGRVGSTGQSTGPHLHFELRQDGRALDPSGRLRP